MTKSRNGQWIIDDPRFQFIIESDIAAIHKIKRYNMGYNSITVVFEVAEGKEIEHTWPRYHFKKMAQNNLIDAMVDIIKIYATRHITNIDVSQRIFEYKSYIFKYNPEKLI